MNEFCFGAIYNGLLWEKLLGVSVHLSADYYQDYRVLAIDSVSDDKIT